MVLRRLLLWNKSTILVSILHDKLPSQGRERVYKFSDFIMKSVKVEKSGKGEVHEVIPLGKCFSGNEEHGRQI